MTTQLLSQGRSKTRWIDQIRKDIEMREKDWGKYLKTVSGRIETAGNFSVNSQPIISGNDLRMIYNQVKSSLK